MNKKVVMAVVSALLIVFCCVCTGVAFFLSQEEQASFEPLAAACDGRAVPGAAQYTPGTPARVGVFERFGSAGWSYTPSNVTNAQKPAGVSDAALVACLATDDVRHVVQQCCFERTIVGIGVPGSDTCYPRVRFARKVQVRIASTGALLAERDVFGPEPPSCDDWVGRRPSAGNFEGSSPGRDELAPFLASPEAPAPASPIPAPVPANAPDASTGK